MKNLQPREPCEAVGCGETLRLVSVFGVHGDFPLIQLPENYPSLKLTANIAPENGWLEDDFPFGGKRPIFRGKLAVSLGEGT